MTGIDNRAVHAENSTITVGGSVNATQNVSRTAAAGDGPPRRERADVGILTVLTEELDAVVERLERHRGYRSVQLPGGVQVHEAEVRGGDGRAVRVAAMQTTDRGPRSATLAFERLRQAYRPSVVLLVGVAGGVGADLEIGDVVIADDVVYYDARREAADGPHRRGQAQAMTATLRNRLNAFFRGHRTVPADPDPEIRVWRGPIGSGDAVVTDSGSDITAWLRAFNEKVLAVETEAGGVGQAFYEHLDHDDLHGWLTVRGISDLADRHKRHDRHAYAARRAAAVTERLLPYLRVEVTR
jgi:adenosylhomocysteine nucleosidase